MAKAATKTRTRQKSKARSKPRPSRKPQVEVSWKSGFRKSHLAPADTVFSEIEQVKDTCGGSITSDELVKAAKTNDVLNPFFTWNDRECGKIARRAEATLLLRSLNVRYITIERTKQKKSKPTRVYEVDRTVWGGVGVRKPYRNVEDIMRDPDAKADLLARALQELVAFRRRFHALQELHILIREIDHVLETTKA